MFKHPEAQRRRKERCQAFLARDLERRAAKGLGRKPKPPRKKSVKVMGKDIWQLMDSRARLYGVRLDE